MRFVTAAVSALALSVAPGAAMAACDDGEIVAKLSHVTNTDRHPKGYRRLWIEKMKPVWEKFMGDIGQENIDAAVNSNFSS